MPRSKTGKKRLKIVKDNKENAVAAVAEKEDILTYLWEDILGSISPPKQISSRGLFDVPELKMIS
jgi:hypothetical protein